MSDLDSHEKQPAPSDPPASDTKPAPIIPAPLDPAPPPAKPPAAQAMKKAPKPPPSRDALSKFKNQNVDEEARMGFIDHLMELRKRLWTSIIAIFICIMVAVVFYKPVYQFLMKPVIVVDDKYSKLEIDAGHHPAGWHAIDITTTTPLGSMIMVIWVGFWAGLVLASPVVLYELWAFVAPGLHDSEKNAIKPVLYGGVFFFSIGAFIAYQYLAPMTLDFFCWLSLDLGLKINWTSETCIEIIITMMIVSGLLCEIPLLVAGLARMSVLEPTWLIKYWKVLTFSSIALGMFVSPGNDLASMSAFSGLILGIYLVSIVMAFVFYKKPKLPGGDVSDSEKKDSVKQP